MEANINKVYRDNKAAAVGKSIICPVCGKIFQKRQYSQAFCSGACKDAFHNAQGDRHNAPRKLDAFGILDAFTKAGIGYRITNMQLAGLDENGRAKYEPNIRVALLFQGSEKYLFMGDSLTEEIERAYNYALESGLLKPGSHA